MTFALFFAGCVLAAPWVSSMFMADNAEQRAARAQMSHQGFIPFAKAIIFVSNVSMWLWGFMHYSWWVVVLSSVGAFVVSIPIGGLVLSRIPGSGVLSAVAIPVLAIALWLTQLHIHFTLWPAKEITWLLGFGYMALTAAIWQSEVFVTGGRKLHEVRWIYHLCFYGALIAAVKGYGWLAVIVALPTMLVGGLLLNWTVGAIWMRIKVQSMERSERD